jgi:hypothetical protein
MKKDDAIKYFGTASNLAKSLGVTKQAVFHWEVIPIGRQYQIEVISKGVLHADKPRFKVA